MSFQSRIVPVRLDSSFEVRRSILNRVLFTVAVWRQRIDMRRRLAEMDARSLRDAGISPAAAAFESGKPFWRKVGVLR